MFLPMKENLFATRASSPNANCGRVNTYINSHVYLVTESMLLHVRREELNDTSCVLINSLQCILLNILVAFNNETCAAQKILDFRQKQSSYTFELLTRSFR